MRKIPVYETPEEQRALFPDISGNTVNGRGERAPRRPSPLFWHYGVDIPHKALQDYYMERFEAFPELQDFHLKYGGRGQRKPPEKPETPETDTPQGWSRRVKECALANEGDLVGIAGVKPEWVFEGYEAPEPWIVMIGVAMNHDELAKAPATPAAVETMAQYNRGTRAARAVANFIQSAGYHARPHGGPTAGPVTLIPAAIEAGLGELGKHGSMINRSYGSSFRLAGVLTDLPLAADGRDVFGADDLLHHSRRMPRARSAPTPARRMRSRAKRTGCAGSSAGMSISQMHPLFQRHPGLRDLHRRLPVEPDGDRAETRREDDPAPPPARRRGLTFGVASPHFPPGSWPARRCPADRAGEARGAMRGHRASASTHPVGRTAPPFGSRPGARPLRRGPRP